jgi:hypothetical protein
LPWIMIASPLIANEIATTIRDQSINFKYMVGPPLFYAWIKSPIVLTSSAVNSIEPAAAFSIA